VVQRVLDYRRTLLHPDSPLLCPHPGQPLSESPTQE
jgi:hypothetical protein